MLDAGQYRQVCFIKDLVFRGCMAKLQGNRESYSKRRSGMIQMCQINTMNFPIEDELIDLGFLMTRVRA